MRRRMSECLKTMQIRETRAVGVEGEHRAVVETAAVVCCPIERVARQNESGKRISSVAVGIAARTIKGGCRETVQGREARAIVVEGEHRANVRTAAVPCRPVERGSR